MKDIISICCYLMSNSAVYLLKSGQALVDDISAAMFNVVFTSLPILLFSVLDRVLDDRLLMR